MDGYSVIYAEVPLKEMFGYSMAVRSLSPEKANFESRAGYVLHSDTLL